VYFLYIYLSICQSMTTVLVDLGHFFYLFILCIILELTSIPANQRKQLLHQKRKQNHNPLDAYLIFIVIIHILVLFKKKFSFPSQVLMYFPNFVKVKSQLCSTIKFASSIYFFHFTMCS
jgi:hypothetical protein